jgi:hypothetical protein
MRLPEQRADGGPLVIRGSEVPFSLFPTDYAGQNCVPLQEPWSYVEFHIKNEYPKHRVRYALAYVEQAQSFFQAARLANRDAAPLLWYYCFLNLVKARLVKNDPVDDLAGAMHGIGDPVENKDGYLSIKKQTISAWGNLKDGSGRYQVFSNLCRILESPLPTTKNLESI